MNSEQVQGTNDSSIVSKLSMVERGYFEDPFIKHFVEKPCRRSPLINRCYYARAAAVSYCIEEFLKVDAPRKQIISLGAGFDTTYFRLKSKGRTVNLTYTEVDFPGVMKRKIALAKRAQLLQNEDSSSLTTERRLDMLIFKSDEYTALGYDLQSLDKRFRTLLRSVGVDFDEPTLFLSEVVLTYLPTKKSSAALQWLTKEFSNALFVIFEQVSPSDSFGKVMCKHFKQIGSPLLTIRDYPTIASHVERHRQLGLEHASATSLDRFYYHCIEEKTREIVKRLELFDEFEAWHRACQHYFILCSTNSNEKKFQTFCESMFEKTTVREEFSRPDLRPANIKSDDDRKVLVQRYGHCSCLVSELGQEYAAVIGGFGIPKEKSAHRRLHDDVCLIDLSTGKVHPCKFYQNETKPLRFPMFGTAVAARVHGKSLVILFGGRASPMNCTNSVMTISFAFENNSYPEERGWFYKTEVKKTTSGKTWPGERWRHSAAIIQSSFEDAHMVVFGGRNNKIVFDDCWRYDIQKHEWTKALLTGINISPRHSHSMCSMNYSTSLVLSGGLGENEEPLNDIFEIEFVKQEFSEANVTRIVTNCSLPPFYSHTTHYMAGMLYIVGGVTSHVHSHYGDEGSNDVIRTVDIKKGRWTGSFSVVGNKALPMILHNHSSVLSHHRDEVWIFGGGDNCFSFGTWFNRSPFRIDLNQFQNYM